MNIPITDWGHIRSDISDPEQGNEGWEVGYHFDYRVNHVRGIIARYCYGMSYVRL